MNILEIKNLLAETILKFFRSKYSASDFQVKVEVPEMIHGDLTTNVCLQMSKQLKISPTTLAEELKNFIVCENLFFLEENIEVKGPGFLNFWVRGEVWRGKKAENGFFQKLLEAFFPRPKVTIPNKYVNKKVLVEHSSPNLFKPFTIGHLMNNFTGEFLVRAMKVAGANVSVTSFPSDISLGIAKAIYIVKKDGGLKQDVFSKSEMAIVKYLGETYVRGVNEYKKAEESKNDDLIREVKNLANNLFNKSASEELEIYNLTKKINLDYLYKNLHNLGSDFDGFIFESESGEQGKRIVLENTPSVFTKSEGAVVYLPSEERKDLHPLVFINSEGNPTYEAKDIGLIDLKFSKYAPDFSFYVADNEQTQHFKVVFDAAGKIKKGWEEKSVFVPHGRMSFKGARMSSRLGGVPTAEEVIESILEAIKERAKEREVSPEIQKEIALSALRISVLRSKPGLNIDFDPERALSFEGDSGPYLCYTSARLHSLLEKGKEKNLFPGIMLKHFQAEKKLERKIFQYENVLKEVVDELAPQKLVTYLFELSGDFNSFYTENKIISDDVYLSEHYLYIVQKTLNTLKSGLDILGIKAPEKM